MQGVVWRANREFFLVIYRNGRFRAQMSMNVAVGATHCAASLSRCCIFAVHALDCTVDALTHVTVDTRLASDTASAEIATSITNRRRLRRRCSAVCCVQPATF